MTSDRVSSGTPHRDESPVGDHAASPNAEQLAASRRLLEQIEKRIDEVGYEQAIAEVEEVLARRRANVS